jgi:ribosomal-protein-alanine N-acetyltransferase
MRTGDLDRVMAIAEGLKQVPHWTRDSYQKALDSGGSPERISLIAEDAESRIAGFAIAACIPPEVELETIAVATKYQRQGIASRLFQELMAEFKERQITEVMLEVRESNAPARALYHSLGFAEAGHRPGYYVEPQEDALLLRRPVL